MLLSISDVSPGTDLRSQRLTFTPCSGKKYLTTMGTIFMPFLLEASMDTVTKLVRFKSFLSSSIDNGAKAFKITALHFVWARLNFASNNCEISFELQPAVSKLKSCAAVWYADVASLAAIFCFLFLGSLFLKN
jgi:hypothetical protein